ncbi:MAG TPA: ArsA family ATPase [Vicinamibacterales bacterium]|nr:ArsA family ATPase [Vicinamibacterales bacterium]
MAATNRKARAAIPRSHSSPEAPFPSWTLFGGKGGVGKTTCAAAWALARTRTGARVLLLSTDPAHSLLDALQRRRAPRLTVMQVDAAGVVHAWLRAKRPAIARLLQRGTLLDQDDIARVLQLPLPGLDELAAFLVMTALERRRYDEIVVDTAPTGHTLRLLETPRLVAALTDLLEAMHARHMMVANALGGVVAADPLVEELRHDAEQVANRLHDAARCALHWVTLPEPVTIEETIDGISWLRGGGFPLRGIVVNRLSPLTGSRCAECRARARFEREALRSLARALGRGPLALRVVAERRTEPRGPAALASIGRELRRKVAWRALLPASARPRPRRARTRAARAPAAPVFDVPGDTRLLLFGGKGGVGKTTCAAAAALSIAAAAPGRQLRLISTDPAPSLADVLDTSVGDTWRRVPGPWSLQARELNAPALFDEYRRRYQAGVNEFFDRLRGGSAFDAVADRAVFEKLFELAPPGIDEVVALLSVVNTVQDRDEDLLIIDTAPTGHTLRLLAMHADAQQWVALLMQLVLKYRLAGRAEELAQDLVRLSRGLRAFRAMLEEPSRARFVAVTRPAALPRLETERLLGELRRMRIASPLLIVNAGSRGTCAACAPRRREERAEVDRLRALCRRTARAGGSAAPREQRVCDIMHAPLRLPPPRGAAELLDWAASWHGDRSAPADR